MVEILAFAVFCVILSEEDIWGKSDILVQKGLKIGENGKFIPLKLLEK